ncbi:MAG: ABC transporter ATP-binding protein [bacterium]|nr:ABC transporter ATP-binding protein [bacterium]
MIIEIKNLNKIYKKNFKQIHALKSIHLKVPKNRILGILGPNGAGKTTLLKIITGITTPEKSSGPIKLLSTTDIKSIKNQIGFLPENPEFLKNISATELLQFALDISNISPQKNRTDGQNNKGIIHQTLERVNLLHEKDEKVKNFSKGMRQRIGIAQAIIHSPELLILDEPMSGLDPPGRRMVIDIIDSYYKKGKTILFSTHNLDDIEALCTDVMVLNHGEIQLEKTLSQLRENSSYKIEVEIDNHKEIHNVENNSQLWEKLDSIRASNQKIIKIQSGIASQLEKYYDT